MVDGITIASASLRPTLQEPRERKKSSTEEDRLSAHALKEAERLLNTGQIKGAEATKVRTLIAQAKTTSENGQFLETKRLANQALDVARGQDENPTGVDPTDDKKEQETNPPSPENTTPSSDTSGGTSLPVTPQESNIYRDGSDDPGISYKMGTPLTELQAPLAVRGHETTHLLHETQKAILEGHRVFSSIRILSEIDPRTGHQHIAGGRATVTIFPRTEPPEPPKPTIDLKA